MVQIDKNLCDVFLTCKSIICATAVNDGNHFGVTWEYSRTKFDTQILGIILHFLYF